MDSERAKKILLIKLGASRSLLISSDPHVSVVVYLVAQGPLTVLAQPLPSSKAKPF